MEKTTFDDLKLKPDFEANDLRIDIIRNYQYTYTTTQTYSPEAVPYHPMGFDLGNGIFYDLNGNLSVRVDHMIGVSPDSAFVIRKILNPMTKRKNTIYTFHGDSLKVSKYHETQGKYRYHRINYSDSIIIKKKNHLRFAIYNADSTTSYKSWSGKRQTIYQLSDDSFVLNREKPNRLFYLEDNSVFLQNKYQIRLNSYDHSISIVDAKKSRLLATLVKNDNFLLIVYPNFKGIKIENYQTGILVKGPSKNISTAYVRSNPK